MKNKTIKIALIILVAFIIVGALYKIMGHTGRVNTARSTKEHVYAEGDEEKKVLYYRHPMNPKISSSNP